MAAATGYAIVLAVRNDPPADRLAPGSRSSWRSTPSPLQPCEIDRRDIEEASVKHLLGVLAA
jgi:hypothetical protein